MRANPVTIFYPLSNNISTFVKVVV